LGGRVGNSTLGLGASARAWSQNRLGAQFEVSRYALDNTDATARVTSIRFEPSLLYTLPDSVTDFVWMRPYLGSGINIRRQTSASTIAGDAPSLSENKLGFQVFGGAELTFAGAPPFALSIDLAHHWANTSLTGIDFGGLGISVAGHWYVK
jgi:opacity protein-like surface antigen